MPEKNPENSLRLVTLVGEIVAAYVSNNSVPPTALPELMASAVRSDGPSQSQLKMEGIQRRGAPSASSPCRPFWESFSGSDTKTETQMNIRSRSSSTRAQTCVCARVHRQ